jgi:hypothetical protein
MDEAFDGGSIKIEFASLIGGVCLPQGEIEHIFNSLLGDALLAARTDRVSRRVVSLGSCQKLAPRSARDPHDLRSTNEFDVDLQGVILYKSLPHEVVGRWLFVQQGSVKLGVLRRAAKTREMAPNTRTRL